MRRTLWILLLLSAFLLLVSPKVVQKTMTFRPGNQWQYITKFGISVGQGTFEARARFKRPYIPEGATEPSTEEFSVDLNFYLDTKWYAALEEADCKAKNEHQIRVEHLQLKGDGEWCYPKVGGLRQQTRPFVWFVAASDCNSALHIRDPRMPPIEIMVRFTGYDNGEFSHEEIGLLSLYSIALLAYSLILGYNVYNYYKDIKRTERMDSPILLLLIAVALQFFAILFQWINLLVYSFDGEGVKACHVLSVIMEVGSEFFVSLLLILLSWGWTITYLEFGDIEMFIPLVLMLLVVHLVLAGLTELTSDAYHKYHDFEGIQGILLVISRLGMFAYFLYGMRDTYQKCRAKAKTFLKPFAYYSGAYLISFPVLLILCQVCAHYVRHKVMVVGSIIAQSAILCILLRLFVGKTSYTDVSKHSDTILPGGKND